jgi:hypothetical protein
VNQSCLSGAAEAVEGVFWPRSDRARSRRAFMSPGVLENDDAAGVAAREDREPSAERVDSPNTPFKMREMQLL